MNVFYYQYIPVISVHRKLRWEFEASFEYVVSTGLTMVTQ